MTFTDSRRSLAISGLALLLTAAPKAAVSAQFFRVVGPTAVQITALTPDGYITWTNAQSGTTYTVQTAQSLDVAASWVPYVQVPASNTVVNLRLYDPHPPAGMTLIPAGSFTMGNCMDSSEGTEAELPLHTVYVSAFYMEKNLVTMSQWTRVHQWAVTNGYVFSPGFGTGSTYPVVSIRWYDMVKYCNARSEMEGRVPAYYTDDGLTLVYRTGQVDVPTNWVNWSSGYRLPTEAEWEKAARGGLIGQRFPWGNTISWSEANYRAAPSNYAYDVNPTNGFNPAWISGSYPYYSYPNPVGWYAANGYGLTDMAGNVYEWCWDLLDDAYYNSSPEADPRGPGAGTSRVIRGGTWGSYAPGCRTAAREGMPPDGTSGTAGLRPVLPAD